MLNPEIVTQLQKQMKAMGLDAAPRDVFVFSVTRGMVLGLAEDLADLALLKTGLGLDKRVKRVLDKATVKAYLYTQKHLTPVLIAAGEKGVGDGNDT